MQRSPSLWAALPLFIVLFIDGMGLSLLFPILNSIIVDPGSDFLSSTVTDSERSFLYGLVVSIFMLCWFFGATILGDLSDVIGRRKSLLICLVGAFLGYMTSALAIWYHSLVFLMAGRIIAGFTAGSQPIAQAAIVDISTEENKARNIGLILLAVSLGFVFGPVIGGVLSDSRLVSWFAFDVPMYFAAFLSLFNAVYLFLSFRETYEIKGKLQVRLHHAITIFISAFKHPDIRYLSVVFFVFIFGWSDFFSFISMFLLHRYGESPLQISLFLAVMGCGFSVGCGWLVGYLAKRFALSMTIALSLIIAAIFIALTVYVTTEWLVWFFTFIIATSVAVGYSNTLTLFSNQVGESEQGWVMGVTGSIMALCFGVNTLFSGFIAAFSVDYPLIFAAIGLCIASVMMLRFWKVRRNLEVSFQK